MDLEGGAPVVDFRVDLEQSPAAPAPLSPIIRNRTKVIRIYIGSEDRGRTSEATKQSGQELGSSPVPKLTNRRLTRSSGLKLRLSMLPLLDKDIDEDTDKDE